jgi:hypothetical protein
MGRYVKRELNMKAGEARGSTTSTGMRDESNRVRSPRRDEDFGARLTSHARQLLAEEISQQVGDPVADLRKVAHALRATSRELEGRLGAQYVGRAAEQLASTLDFLQRAPAPEVVDAVHRFARTRPTAFFSGAFALGLGAGRFLKSSAQQAPRSRRMQNAGMHNTSDNTSHNTARRTRSRTPTFNQ